ncbi:MAG TPA: aldo/keto reductase, partial [Myxococcaceae bacterium]|nr:aldo/keto reductase [Myxococcaceae bacterium]
MNSLISDSFLSRRRILKLAGAALGQAILGPTQALAAGGARIARTIPKSGESLPALGIGSSQTFDVTSEADRQSVKEVMRVFVDLGGRVVDTSPMYGNAESVIGEVADQLGLGGRL